MNSKVIDANLYWFPEELFTDDALAGKFLTEIPAEYGIRDGEWIFIETRRGRITQKARVTDKMRPGVVNCQIGWWLPEAKDRPYFGAFEVNPNVLTTMDPPFDPCMGTYQLRGLLCRIRPNPDGQAYEKA